ncbi:MAG: hypothetical protein F4176_05850, partial [Acidimicrobiia bacterium]|nr:hypothetical protein [Acidimicrobiia bacterium]
MATGHSSTGTSSSNPARGCQFISVVYRSRMIRGNAQNAASMKPTAQVPGTIHQDSPEGAPSGRAPVRR